VGGLSVCLSVSLTLFFLTPLSPSRPLALRRTQISGCRAPHGANTRAGGKGLERRAALTPERPALSLPLVAILINPSIVVLPLPDSIYRELPLQLQL
jgi:hypothetical protein